MDVFSYVFSLIWVCFLKWWVSPHFTPQWLIIFSRKTHGCWGNPPFEETPICLVSLCQVHSGTKLLPGSWRVGSMAWNIMGCLVFASCSCQQWQISWWLLRVFSHQWNKQLVKGWSRRMLDLFPPDSVAFVEGWKVPPRLIEAFLEVWGWNYILWLCIYIYIPLHCEGCCTQLHQNPPPKGIWYEMVSQVFP